MTRVAMLSMHTSPFAAPGVGDGGGMNVYVRELAERMAPAGVQVDVYTSSPTPRPDMVDLRRGLRVHHVPLDPTSPLDERTLRFVNAVEQQLHRNGADVLHAHYWSSGVAGHDLKHRLDLPLVTTFHTLGRVKQAAGIIDRDRNRVAAEESVIACSDAVVANDNSEAAELLRLYNADSDKVYVVSPGVDTRRFAPRDRATARQRLGLSLSRPTILMAGRIQMLKGLDFAVESVAKLRQTIPDVLLIVLGGPSGSDGALTLRSARARIESEGLQDNVVFIDAQPRDSLPTWYSAADVVLMPSRAESFGLVALEASACGTPVVASDVGALPNLIQNAKSGFVVPVGAIDQYARALAFVLEEGDAARRMGAAAVAQAGKFSWDNTVNRTYCLYNRAMDAAMLAGRHLPCAAA